VSDDNVFVGEPLENKAFALERPKQGVEYSEPALPNWASKIWSVEKVQRIERGVGAAGVVRGGSSLRRATPTAAPARGASRAFSAVA